MYLDVEHAILSPNLSEVCMTVKLYAGKNNGSCNV